MLKNMDRLIAEEDLRTFMTARLAFGGDEKDIKAFIEDRERRMGLSADGEDVLGVSKKINSANAINDLMNALS